MNKKLLLITALLGVFIIAGCGTPSVEDNATNTFGDQLDRQTENPDTNTPEKENPAPNTPPNETTPPEKKVTIDEFVQCLKESGIVIYGSKTCPACAALAESFGGYDVINPIYVECTEERVKCSSNMKTGYVPEIQLNGQVYSGPRDLNSLANLTNCKL